MVILLSGASHVGKTLISQKLLEQLHYPYLSIDHLKMGLYRAGKSQFTPLSPFIDITNEIWPIVEGIIRTNIENDQNIIIEGCFIPKDFDKYFEEEYLKHIKYMCIVLSEDYINNHFDAIVQEENAIEKRLTNDVEYDLIKRCNKEHLDNCNNRGYHYYYVVDKYDVNEIVEDFIKYIGE